MKKQNNKYSKGFTLLELLVVIIIIGLLATIIMAAVNSARAKGRDTKEITELKSMQSALQIYFSANGYFPQTCTAVSCVIVDQKLISKFPDGLHYTGVDGSLGQCAAYHMGITLETNNKVLDNDKDMTSNAGGLNIAGYTNLCGNAIAGNSIRGAGDNQTCRNVTGETGDKCYDVTP